jgi:Holliday junction DNA helicase RuvA
MAHLMPATVGACPFSLDQILLEAQEQTMIAKLKGLLDETGTDWAVIDVAGVGYLVHCSSKTLAALGEVGEACTVFTDLQVSENDMRLLGFAEAAERDWFRLLTQVQVVVSKVALAILSALSIFEVQQACAQGDAATVARANGVGPKLAGRIVNELKDKAGALPGGDTAGAGPGATPAGGASADAVSALENLGFKPAVAARAVATAQGELGDGASEGELIRVALKKAAG